MNLNISTISYLPEDIGNKVREYQRLTSKRFETTKALEWTPHVTIADRVLIPEKEFQEITERLDSLCNNTNSIKINLTELAFKELLNSPFENPYMICIKVEVTEQLQKIHDFIQDDIYKGFERPSFKSVKYSPHVTLAYRDLIEKNFEKAKRYFDENPINAFNSVALNDIHLISHLPNGEKQPIKHFTFKP